MTTVAVLSTDRLPKFFGDDHPTEEGLFAEDDTLIAALSEHGMVGTRVPWRRPDIDWRRYDLAILRSTWDYLEDLALFFAVLEDLSRHCRLVNPLATVRWNYDKRYLAELEQAGVPVVPTRYCSRLDLADGVLRTLPSGFVADGIIIKPTIGVGAFETYRIDDPTGSTEAPALELSGDSYMVQPFLPAILSEGEWSFVFLRGALAYTARKVPAAGEWRSQVMYGGRTVGEQPTPSDRAAAEAVMEKLPVEAIYARIDMARLADGGLALMEAELIEPQLFFADIPSTATAFAHAITESL